MSQNKSLLLATFLDIQEDENYKVIIPDFINKLEDEFNIPKEKVFIIKNLTNDNQYIITFIIDVNVDDRINFKDIHESCIMIHKQRDSNTIYTINALNRLIEEQCGLSKGNINYKSIEIDWKKYRNCCILLKNGELVISKTRRIFI